MSEATQAGGPQQYQAANQLKAQAYHYLYGDGSDPRTGIGFALMALVSAVQANTAAIIDTGHGPGGEVRHGQEWREVT